MIKVIFKIILISFIVASIITLLYMVNEISQALEALYNLIAKSAFF